MQNGADDENQNLRVIELDIYRIRNKLKHMQNSLNWLDKTC